MVDRPELHALGLSEGTFRLIQGNEWMVDERQALGYWQPDITAEWWELLVTENGSLNSEL